MPTVAPMVTAVVAVGPTARLEVEGPLGGLTDHTPSLPCPQVGRGASHKHIERQQRAPGSEARAARA
eukprot:SAG31_NODE_9294_length_1303_cov_1.238372_1_plen_66_part_10